jgi:hypothetical protein
MSWDDDVRDADWRAYAIRSGMPVTDEGGPGEGAIEEKRECRPPSNTANPSSYQSPAVILRHQP